MKFKNDAGRSMMEMILYIGITLVMTAATLRLYGESVEKTRMLQLDTQVSDIVEKVNLYYLGRSYPQNAGEINSIIKKNMGEEISLVDPWGSEIIVTTRNTDNANTGIEKPHMDLKISNLDTKRCINVANTFIQKSAVALSINNNKTETNIADVADACSTTSDGKNTVQGFFLKD